MLPFLKTLSRSPGEHREVGKLRLYKKFHGKESACEKLCRAQTNYRVLHISLPKAKKHAQVGNVKNLN